MGALNFIRNEHNSIFVHTITGMEIYDESDSMVHGKINILKARLLSVASGIFTC